MSDVRQLLEEAHAGRLAMLAPVAAYQCECSAPVTPEFPGQHLDIPAPSGWPHSHLPR